MSLLDNPIHLAFILVLVLLVFGARRLPEMGRSLGSGMRGFRDALTGDNATQAHIPEVAAPAPVALRSSTPATDTVATPVAPESVTHAA